MLNNDLISRTALLAAYDAAHKGPPGGARKLIVEAPAVDAAPIVHAQWIEEPDRYYHWHCSACGFVEGIVSKLYYYCPNCGAKIGGENNAEQ